MPENLVLKSLGKQYMIGYKIQRRDECYEQNVDTFVHLNNLIENFGSTCIYDRYSGDTHTACGIYHFTIQSNNIQRVMRRRWRRERGESVPCM